MRVLNFATPLIELVAVPVLASKEATNQIKKYYKIITRFLETLLTICHPTISKNFNHVTKRANWGQNGCSQETIEYIQLESVWYGRSKV